MAKKKNPRRGSMQFWPRVRATSETAKVRSRAVGKEAKPTGFAGYKVGMTHLIYTDNTPNSLTKGQDIVAPVTVIECPPLKVFSVRFYKNTNEGSVVVGEARNPKLDKEVERKVNSAKNQKNIDDVKEFDFIRMTVYTQPKLTGIGKKKPEIFELTLGGSKEDQLAYAKEKISKEISVDEVLKAGNQLDMHVVTTGKGFQGAVKRFGVKIRFHKSEKGIRTAGSLGPWKGQGHIMYRTPAPGKMGYHLRTEYNKWLLKISNDPKEVNPKGGFINFGEVKSTYILVKGSVGGPKKRMVRFNLATRENKKVPNEAPTIQYVSIESKQG